MMACALSPLLMACWSVLHRWGAYSAAAAIALRAHIALSPMTGPLDCEWMEHGCVAKPLHCFCGIDRRLLFVCLHYGFPVEPSTQRQSAQPSPQQHTVQHAASLMADAGSTLCSGPGTATASHAIWCSCQSQLPAIQIGSSYQCRRMSCQRLDKASASMNMEC